MATTGHETERITVERLKQAMQGLNDKQGKVIPMNAIPTASTLTYTVTDPLTSQAVTKNFKVGDRVIVTDSEHGDEEYDNLVVYTLLKLTTSGNVTTALWAPGGAGSGGGDALGKIRVNLTAIINGSQAAASNLNGVVVSVQNTTDNTQAVTQTWAGTTLVFSKLTPLKEYTITVQSKTGYYISSLSQVVSSMDIGGDVTKTFEYSAIEYAVEMTSNQGTDEAIADAYLTGSYTYNEETVSFGSQLHNGDTVLMPSDTDTSTIAITGSSNITDYAKQTSVDTTNKKLCVAYSTTIVYAQVTSNQSGATLSGVVCKVNGTAVTSSQGKKVATGSSFTFATENDLAGYQKVVTNDGSASGTSQIVGVAYNAELVSVALAADTGSPDLSGVTINIYDASDDSVIATGTGSITNQPIASGTSYYVGVTGSVSGYGNPANTSAHTAASTANASNSIALQYVYGVLIIELTTSNDDDTELAKMKAYITIGSGSEQEMSGTISSHVKTFTQAVVPGTTYSVRFNDVDSYITPAAITNATKGAGAETIQKEYTYNPIKYAYIKFDQTKSDDTQMITVSETLNGTAQTLNTTTGKHANAALQAIRDSSHLYMGKYGNGTMALRQLKDDDGTKYADDNSNANMDGMDGDHFLRINAEFYIKRVSGSDSGDTVVYGVAVGGKPDNTWKQVISPSDLLGVHEAIASDTGNNTSGVLYSKSGMDSTGNVSQDNFKQKARNKGTGFTLVTWEWHCIMAMLFYGWYGRTNAQAQCGTGASTYNGSTRYTGLKDSLGMTDTTTSNGNTDNIKFWGIENWWGCKYEFVDNVVVDARVWKVTDKSGSQRTAGTGASTSNCIKKMLLSENLDMIPTDVVSDSNYTTYYCDRYYQSADNSRVVLRSCFSAIANGGVAYVDASDDASYTYANIGSRLAFNGAIEQASVMKLRFRTAGDGAVAGATVTVTTPTGTETHTTDSNGEVTIFNIAGSTCTVACNTHDLNVSQFTVTDGSTVTITATEKPLTTGYIILDQTSNDPTTKVLDMDGNTYSNYSRPAVITAIRSMSHCYVGTFANDVMTLKQLSDSDGTMYADGTSAATDITGSTGGNVFMRLPYFFTRVSEYATDKIKIEFAIDEQQTATTTRTPSGNGWKQWGGNDLIGKYEACSTSTAGGTTAETANGTSGYLRSRSTGADSLGNVSQANFKQKARNNGTGFSLVKWRHQNIMAILFYAYYGHTNCQTLIGSGASAYSGSTRYIGLKNSLGMTDTTSSNGNTDNIVFWGLENWWGCKYEWVDNVVIDNHTWTITEDDSTTRTIQASDMASGNGAWIYPSKFILGDDLDTIAAAGQSGGGDSQGYCDGQYYTADSSRVVRRSYGSADASGGVACVYAGNDASRTYASYGSRLAFTGQIVIA